MKRRGGRRTPSPPNLDRSTVCATANATIGNASQAGGAHSGGGGVLTRFLSPLFGGSSTTSSVGPKSSEGAEAPDGQVRAKTIVRLKRKKNAPMLPGRRPKIARVADGGVAPSNIGSGSEGNASNTGSINDGNGTANGAIDDQSLTVNQSKKMPPQKNAGLVKGSSKGRRKVVLPGRNKNCDHKKAGNEPPPEPAPLTSILKKPKPPPPPEPPVCMLFESTFRHSSCTRRLLSITFTFFALIERCFASMYQVSVAYYETIGFGFRVFGQKPPLQAASTSSVMAGVPVTSSKVAPGVVGSETREAATAATSGGNGNDASDIALNSEATPLSTQVSAPEAPLLNSPPPPPLQRSLSWRDDSFMGSVILQYFCVWDFA